MNIGAGETGVFLLFWVGIGGGVGFLIGQGKGRGLLGFVLGLVLGVVGWIIVAVLRPTPESEARRLVEVQDAMRRISVENPTDD